MNQGAAEEPAPVQSAPQARHNKHMNTAKHQQAQPAARAQQASYQETAAASSAALHQVPTSLWS